MCVPGSFNPYSDDPLPAYPKKQLILKIISGQQLPKPPDSMLGDRGEVSSQTSHYPEFTVVQMECAEINVIFYFFFLFTAQIIDPFVEVEIIGLPVDCCKEQTRVVDDNGKIDLFFMALTVREKQNKILPVLTDCYYYYCQRLIYLLDFLTRFIYYYFLGGL